MKKNQHVVSSGDKWAVKGEKNAKASSLHETQKEAISAARQIAMNNHSELIIHGRDGKIREKDSFGNDAFPPKG
jgi:hypothetical protein